jgi:acyl transferase domain-containing protein/acyl carrier protein
MLGQRDAAAAVPVQAKRDTASVEIHAVLQFLNAQLAEVLYLEAGVQDIDLPFSELGLDSVTGVEWVQSINAQYRIRLAASELFNHPTLRQLTQHVCGLVDALPCPPSSAAASGAGGSPAVEAALLANAPDVQADRAAEPMNYPASGPAVRSTGGPRPEILQSVPTGELVPREDAIAVVGMACRYADASSPDELWQNLAAGRDSVKRADRWPELLADETPIYGSFLTDIGRFDPMFFKISATEAKYMDPQQRIFLEECWKAIEDAGYAGCIEGSNCGVYVGCGSGDYASLIKSGPPQAFWGNALSVVASRISYYLDLHGPAVAIDTACSSSLVAIHIACRALAGGEVDLALAGGVTALATPGMLGSAAGAGMLSPTGRCHSFDDRADGFVAGEGAGVLLLKRLGDALRDNDNIHGVIRGSGINQDGLTNGITAPSAKSQERLESTVYDRYGIDPETITLVEAHGTGTILGDPIEFQALCEAFGKRTSQRQFCALGSIKSNIGHTIAAAGVAGVLKALLALKHKQLPPSLHYRQPNPAVDFARSPFYLNTGLRDWQVPHGQVRRAAVSSFGFSGTNAHLVIDEALVRDTEQAATAPRLVVLSAQSLQQLDVMSQALVSALYCTTAGLDSIAYTLGVGRRQLPYRLAVVARSVPELIQQLTAWREPGADVVRVHSNDATAAMHGLVQAAVSPLTLQELTRGEDSAADAHSIDLLESAALQFMHGRRIDFGSFFHGRPRRVSLPVYAFADEHYWVDPPQGEIAATKSPGMSSPAAGQPIEGRPATGSDDWLLQSLYRGDLSVDEVLTTLT